MITCYNCGKRYEKENIPESDFMYCSTECFEQDEARLVEGNGIITAAEQLETKFTDINKLKLDVHAPAAAKAVTDIKQMNNMLGFNRAERSDHSNLSHVNQQKQQQQHINSNDGENGDLK